MTRTGILGGSFNPIHNGHIALARGLLDEASLDDVWFMVSPQNPFKQHGNLLDDDKRLLLVKEALAGEQRLKACDYEFHLPRPSYTWNTLRHLAADFPDHEFTLLIGGDNWQCFNQWAHAADIISHYSIVVYPRLGSEPISTALPPTVTVANTPLINISSTEIRQRIARGESIEGLVPSAVERAIARDGLYK